MMKKKYLVAGLAAVFALSLAACGEKEKEAATAPAASNTEQSSAADNNAQQETAATEQTITYLGKDYVVPAQVNNIVAASLESGRCSYFRR
ncbi:hypothetical protein D3C78_812490 [compost metagenome]